MFGNVLVLVLPPFYTLGAPKWEKKSRRDKFFFTVYCTQKPVCKKLVWLRLYSRRGGFLEVLLVPKRTPHACKDSRRDQHTLILHWEISCKQNYPSILIHSTLFTIKFFFSKAILLLRNCWVKKCFIHFLWGERGFGGFLMFDCGHFFCCNEPRILLLMSVFYVLGGIYLFPKRMFSFDISL